MNDVFGTDFTAGKVLIEDRVRALGRTMPSASAPAANYVSWVRSGSLLFVSGQISQADGMPFLPGRLGAELTVEDGRRAAEAAALAVVSQIAAAADGSVANVRRIVRLCVFIASTPDFTEHPRVANGASDLLMAIFGDAGRHARAAIGVASLPRGSSVEIDAIVELSP